MGGQISSSTKPSFHKREANGWTGLQPFLELSGGLITLTVLIALTIIALLVPITSLIYITAKVKPVIIGYVLVPVTAVMWAAVMWVLLVVPLVVEMGFEIFFDRPVIHIMLKKPMLLLQLQNVSACKNWVKKKTCHVTDMSNLIHILMRPSEMSLEICSNCTVSGVGL